MHETENQAEHQIEQQTMHQIEQQTMHQIEQQTIHQIEHQSDCRCIITAYLYAAVHAARAHQVKVGQLLVTRTWMSHSEPR